MPSFDYIVASRLDPSGQRYQGDIFAAAPFLSPTADGRVEIETRPAILLTPTCDFALKTGSGLRQLHAIAVFEPDNPLLRQFRQGIVPQHVVPLPPLPPFMPQGGAALMRHSSPIHTARLERLERVTTLNEVGLRSLLKGHTRYYLRLVIDAAQVPIPPDDPRRLWGALDAVADARGFDNKRDAVMEALKIAITAVAQHYGVTAPTHGVSLYRLRALSEKGAVSVLGRQAIDKMVAMEGGLVEVYRHPPRDKTSSAPLVDRCLVDLAEAAWVLQERDAPQFPESKYRALFADEMV